MDLHSLDLGYRSFCSSLRINLDSLQFLQRLPSINDLAKYCIFPIQRWLRCKCQEELTAIRVLPLVRHTQNSSRIVPQSRSDLILEGRSENRSRGLRFGISRGGTRLHYERRYYAMERRGVVEIAGAKGEEVFNCFRRGCGIEFDFDRTKGSMELGRLECYPDSDAW